jgi:hypothetical protein
MESEFDQDVNRALEKWPNVPACYGWLKLDRRGNWLIKDQPITHKRSIEFLSRNYANDGAGQWFVQNGPQRAYCDLAYTPWVYHLDGHRQLFTHVQSAVENLSSIIIDEDGNLLLETEFGIGVLHDSDLVPFFDVLAHHQNKQHNADDLMAMMLNLNRSAKDTAEICWQHGPLRLRTMLSDDIPREFNFVVAPIECNAEID